MQREVKVLVIDNGMGLGNIISDASKFSSWEYVIASGQEEAMMHVHAEQPEIIILGYIEPRGTSFKIHEQFKENPETANIPQIIIDVAPEEQATRGWRKSEGLLMEAEEYICQPVTPEELGEIIERILAKVKVTDFI